MIPSIYLRRDQARDKTLSRSDIGQSNSLKQTKQSVLMTKTQLNNEYSRVMREAAVAPSRKETMNLYKKARLIKKELQFREVNSPRSHLVKPSDNNE